MPCVGSRGLRHSATPRRCVRLWVSAGYTNPHRTQDNALNEYISVGQTDDCFVAQLNVRRACCRSCLSIPYACYVDDVVCSISHLCHDVTVTAVFFCNNSLLRGNHKSLLRPLKWQVPKSRPPTRTLADTSRHVNLFVNLDQAATKHKQWAVLIFLLDTHVPLL